MNTGSRYAIFATLPFMFKVMLMLQFANKWDELLEWIIRLLFCHTYAWILL